MATIKQSAYITGVLTQAFPSFAGAVCSARAQIAFKGDEAAGTIFELLELPAGCRVVDVIFDSDDLDTHATPTITWDVGFMSGAPGEMNPNRTCGAELLSGSDVSKAGGVARPTLKTAYRTASTGTPRSIGAKLATAPATAGGGVIGLTVLYSAT